MNKKKDFEYLAIIVEDGEVGEIIPCTNHKEAKRTLLEAAHDHTEHNYTTLAEAESHSSKYLYRIWRLDDDEGRYNEIA